MSSTFLRDYGWIGNRLSGALISRFGGIEWCCLPYFDSDSHFAALLDEFQGGIFLLQPEGEYRSQQRYLPGTNCLETRFETALGSAVLLDWMPSEPGIRRRLQGIDGRMEFNLLCAPRFAYGAEAAQVEQAGSALLFRDPSHETLALLQATFPLSPGRDGASAVARFSLDSGQQHDLRWSWGRQELSQTFESPDSAVRFWRQASHQCPAVGPCPFSGPWHDLVVRSGLVLRSLSARYSGAIAEAPTTSLPSLTGGSKNWDYRYCWIRDCSHAIQALEQLGLQQEAHLQFEWLSNLLIRDGAERLQAVYTLDGGRYLPERELSFLGGWRGSRPVRIGNLSARQFSLDIFGHLLLAASHEHERSGKLPEGLWPRLADLADTICQAWRRPDRGPWEIRTKPEHHVASKVMCWVALDRAITLAGRQALHVPRRWLEERDILHDTICDQGFDRRRGSFVRAFGARDLDAACLLIPMMGFLPSHDERVVGTLQAIQEQLGEGVLIHRLQWQEDLPETDGAHLLCSFWFVCCLALAGRLDEASDRLAELCTYASPLGLFGEQVSASTNEVSGNYPSSAVHIALINACAEVAAARARLLAEPKVS